MVISVPAPKQVQMGQNATPPQPFGIEPSPQMVQSFGVQHALLSQTRGDAQVPQLSVPPHALEGAPQVAPSPPQVFGVQPHTYGVPPPAHVSSVGHVVPQLSAPPQPSGGVPQLAPIVAQVVGVHPHTLATPAPAQVSGAAQPVPVVHVSVSPQPSEIVPQFLPAAAHVVGLHAAGPHTLGPPPPQNGLLLVGSQPVGQTRVFPHPSGIVPQLNPIAAHVVGLHAHALSVQTCEARHDPQSSAAPHPSFSVPQVAWRAGQVVGWHLQAPSMQL